MAAYESMSVPEQQSVRSWVDSMGGSALFELELPHMQRLGLKAVRAD